MWNALLSYELGLRSGERRLETRLVGEDGTPGWLRDRQYRKADLYDEVLRFDVQVVKPAGLAHLLQA